MLPAMYYADKLATLTDLFGAPAALEGDTLVVGGTAYPIVDDVIILLPPSEYPPALRARLAARAVDGEAAPVAPGSAAAPLARDVQFTFGAEWQAFAAILPEHAREFAQYFDLVDLAALRDCRVCDLGCGSGRWSYFLRHRCRELVLVDFSDAIFVARQNLRDAPHALFFLADIMRLPFRPYFADFALCLGVLHHLPMDALAAARRLGQYAPTLLIYLYYALDNRPWHFRLLLAGVTAVRRRLARVQAPQARALLTWLLATLVYLPLVGLGHALRPVGLARHVPLYEMYRGKSLRRIRQDVYDRFFTPIEQRVTRQQILALQDTFERVVVSEQLPYWHFLCQSHRADRALAHGPR